MLYKIINMSDPYTIECPDLAIATVCCVLLGRGQYAFDNVTDPDKPGVPIFLFGDTQNFMTQHFSGTPINTFVHRQLAHRPEDIATALESVIIGDRKEWEAAIQFVQTDLLPAFKESWHEQRLSSMNDIGRRAWKLADDIRHGRLQLQPPPQQVFRA